MTATCHGLRRLRPTSVVLFVPSGWRLETGELSADKWAAPATMVVLPAAIWTSIFVTTRRIASAIDGWADGDPGWVAVAVIALAGFGLISAIGALWATVTWKWRALPAWLPPSIVAFVLIGMLPWGRRGSRMSGFINDTASVETGSAFTLGAVVGLLLCVATLWLVIRFWPKQGEGRRARRTFAPNDLSPLALTGVCVAVWVIGAALTAAIARA